MGFDFIVESLILFLTFFLATVVYRKNPRSSIHRVLALTIATSAMWGTANIFETAGLGSTISILLLRLDFAIAAIGVYFWLLFCRFFPQQRFTLHRKQLLWAIPSFTLAAFSFTNLIIRDITLVGNSIQYQIGPLYYVYGMVLIIYMLFIGCGSLFYKYIKAKGSIKAQLAYIFIGLLFGGSFVVLVNVYLPLVIPDLSAELSRVGVLGLLIFTSFATYAIIKHRLMDIRMVVFKSVAYSIVLGVIAGAYAFAAQLVMVRYKGVVNQNLFNILVIFAAIFGFNPLRQLIERFTDKVFYKGRYNPQELLAKFNDAMSSTIVLDTLVDYILKTMRDEIKIRKVALILVNGGNILKDMGEGDLQLSGQAIDKLVDLCQTRKTIVTDEVANDKKSKEILRELDVSILIPLCSEDNLIGLLVLGDKKSGDIYTLQDIKFLELLAPEAAIAIKNAELFEEKNMRVRELTALNKLAFTLGTNLNLSAILNGALKQVMLVTQADSGSIMLLDEDNQVLTIKASKGLKKDVLKKTQLKVGEGIAGWVAKTREPLILVDDLDPRFQNEQKRQEIISAITVPLKSKEKVIGVLSVNRKTSTEIFSKENLDVVVSFAGQLAVAIENAKLYKDLENTFIGTISALAAAVDAKDPYTYGHSNDVMEYAVAIAEQMQLPKHQIETIRIGAALHDIGKIGIDGSILNKPGKLNSEERLIINRHPTIAVNILESLDFLKEAVPLILFHHERYDGKGYPSGIAGEAIPIGARIIAVADSFNAMVSRRPYRPPMSFAAAIKELKDNVGTQFDPRAVSAFLEVLAKAEPKEKQNIFASQKQPSHQKIQSKNR